MPNTQLSITLDTLVAQAEDVISAPVGNEVVMLRLESSAYYDTDDIGAEIWQWIAIPITVRALCDRLLSLYDVPADQCHADVLAFLQQAFDEGTIQIVAPTSGQAL
ncbi:MAG: PqqD family peptide modification chaperone [Chloroflexi bacterium]|nr:PqqD family peptide modification chaperone [Chloroflexota bacterium]MBU1750467.1 PqqD family peptide modification chaperone [Chloroflexota bacterium]MBU1879959.1 PqqD family peptide modification chaperone [Chloroflexota bacterium]